MNKQNKKGDSFMKMNKQNKKGDSFTLKFARVYRKAFALFIMIAGCAIVMQTEKVFDLEISPYLVLGLAMAAFGLALYVDEKYDDKLNKINNKLEKHINDKVEKVD